MSKKHLLLCCFVSFGNELTHQPSIQAAQAHANAQNQVNQPVTQQFFKQNYTAPLYVQSKINQALRINTIGFTSALVQKRTLKTFEEQIESLTSNADGSIAVVWDKERVSVGDRNSFNFHDMDFPKSFAFKSPLGQSARNIAIWNPDGGLTIAGHQKYLFNWQKQDLNERVGFGCTSDLQFHITCFTQNAKTTFVGFKNGSIGMRHISQFRIIFSPQSPSVVQDMALLDDKHLVVIYENKKYIQMLDLSQFNIEKYWSPQKKERGKVIQTQIPLEGVSCSAIAVLNPQTIILGSDDGMIRALEKDQEEQWLIKSEARGAASGIKKVIPCGECIIVVGKKDPAFYIRYSTGALVYTINAPRDSFVVDVTTFPDGSFVAAYSNKTLEFFEVQQPALQQLTDRCRKDQLNTLGVLIQKLTELELNDIPRDEEHLGVNVIAFLQQLPSSLRNNLLQNHGCFLNQTHWPSEVRNAGTFLAPHSPNFFAYFERFFSKHKIFIGLLIATTLVMITGKPTKIARILRPVVKFPLKVFSYLRGSPTAPLATASISDDYLPMYKFNP